MTLRKTPRCATIVEVLGRPLAVLLITASLALTGGAASAQERSSSECSAGPGLTFLHEISAALGYRRMLVRGETATVETRRYAIDAGVTWRPPCVRFGVSQAGLAVELAAANHLYDGGGTKTSFELGVVGLARLPVSPRVSLDLRAAALKTVHDIDDRHPPSIIGRAGGALRFQLRSGSTSFLAAGIDAELFTRPEKRTGDDEYGGTAIGWGLFGVLRAEGPAALVVTGLAAVVGLIVYQRFASEDTD